jgi:hypothetical protein
MIAFLWISNFLGSEALSAQAKLLVRLGMA